MNELQLFSYGSNTVRTVKLDGQIWFVAKDVCDILELSNVTEALRPLDEDELSSVSLKSGGQDREMRLISESGLYGLVFRSNKPEAKRFSKWVRSTVLPQLNHTGTFSIGQESASPALCEDLKAVQLVLEPAGITGNQLSLALDKVYKSHTGRSALQVAEVQLVAPTKEQLLTPTDIGKVLGVSARIVNKLEPYAVIPDVRQLKWTSAVVEELSPNFN